jgi:hypothetical protein
VNGISLSIALSAKKTVIGCTFETHSKALRFYSAPDLCDSNEKEYGCRVEVLSMKEETFDLAIYCPICGKQAEAYSGIPYYATINREKIPPPELYDYKHKRLYRVMLDPHPVEDKFRLYINCENCWVLNKIELRWAKKFLSYRCVRKSETGDFWVVDEEIFTLLKKMECFVHVFATKIPFTTPICDLEDFADATKIL